MLARRRKDMQQTLNVLNFLFEVESDEVVEIVDLKLQRQCKISSSATCIATLKLFFQASPLDFMKWLQVLYALLPHILLS